MPDGIARIAAERRLVARDGSFNFTELHESLAEIVVGAGILWLECDRRAQNRGRLGTPPRR
jgi:hypothetical protein